MRWERLGRKVALDVALGINYLHTRSCALSCLHDMSCAVLCCAGLGWAGLGWAWAGLGWAVLGCASCIRRQLQTEPSLDTLFSCGVSRCIHLGNLMHHAIQQCASPWHLI